MRQLLPDDRLGVEHGAVDARAYEARAIGVAHAHDAAVAAAHAAAHDLLERDDAAAIEAARERGDGAHHRRRAAAIDRDIALAFALRELALERCRDEPAIAA